MNKRHTFLIPLVTLLLLSAATLGAPSYAAKLDEAAIFIEINDTDGDAGIQIFLDGEGWDTMQLRAPNGNVLFSLMAENSVGIQGLTELFFESAEPSFDEQPLDEFLDLFPPGRYSMRGTTTEGEVITGAARLSHKLPEGPVITSPQEDEVVSTDAVVVSWEKVPNPPGSKIIAYQVIVEKDEGTLRVFSADVNSKTRSISIPPEFMQAGFPYKAEVIAKEKTGNQTISEIEFETSD